MAEAKDKITCHVLNTTTGLPAKAVRVRLELSSPTLTTSSAAPIRTFESLTDDDGRIKVWLPFSADNSSGEVPLYTLDDVLDELKGRGASRWTLRFDTGGYFGEEETFFPEVVVTFVVGEGKQYHVPLLLSPYSYTTYRGS